VGLDARSAAVVICPHMEMARLLLVCEKNTCVPAGSVPMPGAATTLEEEILDTAYAGAAEERARSVEGHAPPGENWTPPPHAKA